MAFVFSTLERPKKAARRLTSLLSGQKLATVQEAVARTLGHADWFAFRKTGVGSIASPLDQALETEAFRIRAGDHVRMLAVALGVNEGDVQYALATSRLTGDRPWVIEDHLSIRAKSWARGLRSEKTRYRAPGDIVRIRSSSRKAEYGYLLSTGEGVRVLLDDSILHCADFEIVRPRVRPDDFVPLRYWLPYGFWTLSDGSEVIFSRDYFPLWRIADSTIERLPPWLWINNLVDQHHFITLLGEASWNSSRTRLAALGHLEMRGVRGLPALADVLPNLFLPNVTSPHTAVAAEFRRRGKVAELPPFAHVSQRLNWD